MEKTGFCGFSLLPFEGHVLSLVLFRKRIFFSRSAFDDIYCHTACRYLVLNRIELQLRLPRLEVGSQWAVVLPPLVPLNKFPDNTESQC